MERKFAAQLLRAGIALFVLLNGASVFGQEEAHYCVRRCDENTEPMVCEYSFEVEWYLTLSKACYDCPFVESDCYRPHCIPADGNRRALIAINRQYPGPTVEVCEGDTVVVHVTNSLANGEGTTIHWHGVHQRGTPYADGTNMVTQCPISEKSTFTYEFEASPSGTQIYHAHTGLHMADGLLGAFLIHSYAEEDPAYDLYDHDCDTPHGHCEQMIALHDWMPETFVERWAKLKHNSFDNSLPMSSLINGKMKRYEVHNETNPEQTATTPYTVYQLQQGRRYRFRLIGEGHMPCAYKVSVDGHNLLVIATDGRPVKPVEVEAIIVYSGERFDFVLSADNPSGGNFWLKAHATNFCRTTKPNAYAIVRYEGAPEEDPPGDKDEDRGEGYLLQPILGTFNPDDLKYQHGEPYDITVDELDHAHDEDFTDEVVDETYYLTVSLIQNDNSRFHHSEYYPIDGVPANKRASSAVLDNVVEIIMLNNGGSAHPMHMHGYSFRVMGTEYIGDTISLEMIQEMNENGQLKKKLINPSYYDTVTVHGYSYVVIRLVTDNPGYWLLHCHFTDHLDSGQIVLLAIGEHSALPPVPEGFPQCGDWSTLERRLKQQQEKADSEKYLAKMSQWSAETWDHMKQMVEGHFALPSSFTESSAGPVGGGGMWVSALGLVAWIFN